MSLNTVKTEVNKQKAGVQPRPPIVVIMGHVDHGKTSLLDHIRKSTVASREAGNITQSIGAYEVELDAKSGEHGKITFIDTPGHEAFSKMRARGATAADVAILVVAADEGLKPQTRESIKILKDTNTDFIVAITKIDRNNADIERVKNELSSEGILLEGSGGSVSWQGVSVVSGEGVKEILELIVLHAEIAELSYNASLPGRGFVIEAHKDSRRGIVASVILKNGSLREGDKIATESASGKVKSLENFLLKRVKTLLPSSPAIIVGFDDMPRVGEEFWIGEPQEGVRMEAPESLSTEKTDKLKAILKADTAGSLEALKYTLKELVHPVMSSVGDITASDIRDAQNTGSVIVAFGVKAEKGMEFQAEISKVKIYSSKVVYELVKEIELQLKRDAALGPSGELLVLKVFDGSGKKQLVGGRVEKGVIKKKADIEVFRNDTVVGSGRITNLQSGKKDVLEVESGECGLMAEADTKILEGDVIKAY